MTETGYVAIADIIPKEEINEAAPATAYASNISSFTKPIVSDLLVHSVQTRLYVISSVRPCHTTTLGAIHASRVQTTGCLFCVQGRLCVKQLT